MAHIHHNNMALNSIREAKITFFSIKNTCNIRVTGYTIYLYNIMVPKISSWIG